MKTYEIVAAMVLRVGGQAAGGMRPLSWSELGEIFGVTKDVSRHRLTRFKQKYNIVDADIVDGWNREFLRVNTPEEEKNELAGLQFLPGDLQIRQTRDGAIPHVVVEPSGTRVTLVEDKPVKVGAAIGTPITKMPTPEPTPVPNDDTQARVIKNVAEQMGIYEKDIKLDQRFVEDLGADSLDLVELAMALEDEFEYEIADEEAEKVVTVQDAINLIRMKRGLPFEITLSFTPPPLSEQLAPVTPDYFESVVPASDIKNVAAKQIDPLQYIITPAVLVVVRDGQPLTIDKTHKNFARIEEALKAGQWQEVLDFIDMKNALTRYSNGRVTVEGGSVTLDGDRVPGKVTNRLVKALQEENLEALEGISNFLTKCDENPDHRVVTRIYDFIAHNDLRLDKEGNILAYKVVKSNYFDKYTGTMDNSPGKLVRMKRNQVNPVDSETCSFGLHVAARKYIPKYGNPGSDKVLLCRVNPKDFVSIPTDYDSMKARVCEYFVLKDVTENFTVDEGIEA